MKKPFDWENYQVPFDVPLLNVIGLNHPSEFNQGLVWPSMEPSMEIH